MMQTENSDNRQSNSVAEFLREIELIRGDSKEVSFLDAVVHYCEQKNLDIDEVGNFIKKNVLLKSKIQEDAESLNYIEKSSQLPL